MSEDVLLHLASNSSNQSDQSLPSKIAKLEARMVGKTSTAVVSTLQLPAAQAAATRSSISSSSAAKFGANAAGEIYAESLDSSDSEEDDSNGREFLIQANFQKRRKLADDADSAASGQIKVAVDARQKVVEAVEVKSGTDVNKRKQTRGKGNSTPARGRGSNDQTRIQNSTQLLTSSNGLHENSHHKESSRLKEQLGQNERALLDEELTSLRAKIITLEEDLKKARQEASEYQHLCQQLEKELKELKNNEQQVKPKRMKVISDLLISVSKAERQEARTKVRQDSLRLGNVGVIRAGTVISETWEDGQAIKDLNAHLRRLLELREAVERQRKSLKKKQPDKGEGTEAESTEEDIIIQDEIYKSRLASIKREEESYVRERDRYELEKGRLIREMKRIRDEDGSRFNNYQILNHRYALLNLLGKGGFSEVYKAFDLVEYRYVACKLHGLNAQWSEDKKQSYIRHAIREYNIHKTLVHHHIVRLWDIFEIDQNTFCTILDYCSGKDLDAVLKATPILPEKEARIIIYQIFQGLIYLNKRNQKIIHYDLKPGNVLFDEFGVAKVTDFGLSKIVEDDVGSQGMELTSQGAGTYWYLPQNALS